MSRRIGGEALRRLEAIVSGGVPDDEALVGRFVDRGEGAEDAFGLLVERHGPAVYRACRAMLGEEQAARDAFQATFLVLARKAGSLRVGESVGPWLMAVAVRVSASSRVAEARRRKHEGRLVGSEARSDGDPAERREVVELVREEVARLPDRLRAAVVACDLEGLGHEQAARRLGWPVGTVKSRQARGREVLRKRLARRGLASPMGMSGLVPAVSTEVPRGLSDVTIRNAIQVASSRLVEIGGPTAPFLLMNGVLRSMTFTTLGLPTTLTLLAGIASFWAVTLASQADHEAEIAIGGQEGPSRIQVEGTGTKSEPADPPQIGDPPRIGDTRVDIPPPFGELIDILNNPEPLPGMIALPSARELFEARLKASDRMVRSLIQELLEPPRGGRYQTDVETILDWLRRRLQDRLALAGTEADRNEALSLELGQIRAFEALCSELARGAASPVSDLDLVRVRYRRLEIESELVGQESR